MKVKTKKKGTFFKYLISDDIFITYCENESQMKVEWKWKPKMKFE